MDFAEAKMKAPDIPAETCPVVDMLSTYLSGLESDVEIIRAQIKASRLKNRDSIAEDLLAVESGFGFARDLLERLRNANHQLRESSYYWYMFAKDKEA